MSNIYWVGPRESDMLFSDNLFSGSITYYGSGQNGNCYFCDTNNMRINHNITNKRASDYIRDCQLSLIQHEPDCRFMAYNPNYVYGAPEAIVNRTMCLNEPALMEKLSDKTVVRQMVRDSAPLLPDRIMSGRECGYQRFCEQFPGFSSFVVQRPVSSGGQDTFLFDRSSAKEVSNIIAQDKMVIISGFVKNNIPVNVHAVIYSDAILMLPGSVQIIQSGNHRLLYRGADYIAFASLSCEIQDKVYSVARSVFGLIQRMGYLGIVGADLMVVGNEIYFNEINNRFQGSSILLSKALMEQHLPSLPQLNMDAFFGKRVEEKTLQKCASLTVPYSIYTYLKDEDSAHANHIREAASREQSVQMILNEGYDPNQPTESYAFLFSLIFSENIVTADEYLCCVRLHPNVSSASLQWRERLLSRDLTALKIALLNQGVVLTERAKEFVYRRGGMREGTYHSLDLFIEGSYINSPLSVKLVGLTPFSIDVDETSNLQLFFLSHPLFVVDYDRKTELHCPDSHLCSVMKEIFFFATDRLRIQNNYYCTFVRHGVPCKFCEASGIEHYFNLQDILACIDYLFSSQKRPHFRHILIGGLSNEIGQEKEAILNICKCIRKYTDVPIYLMCLPPSPGDVVEYAEAGVTEFGFNIELFDRNVARQMMPGKGCITLEKYLIALRKAVECCGSDGAVRTAFIVGLESKESLLRGIETVCRLGVSPILSVFRPIPGTDLQHVIPPSDEYLAEILKEAQEICVRYGLSLGPTCPACRNNTLTFVERDEVRKIYSPLWRRAEYESGTE